MVWNKMTGSGVKLNCDFIDSLPAASQETFCKDLGNVSLADDGLTIKEACCACGGGETRFLAREYVASQEIPPNPLNVGSSEGQYGGEYDSFVRIHRALTEDPASDLVDILNKTLNEDDGPDGGFPNLEYLVLGYDIIRGNPRYEIDGAVCHARRLV